jgi:hypothetical protein
LLLFNLLQRTNTSDSNWLRNKSSS